MQTITYDPVAQVNVQRVVLGKQALWEMGIIALAEVLIKRRRSCKP